MAKCGCLKYLVSQHSTPLASMTERGRDYIQKNVDLPSNGLNTVLDEPSDIRERF